MSNPLFNKNAGAPNNPIDALNSFINGGGSPQQAMELFMKQNPKASQIMTQINNMKGNQSLEEFALQVAKQKGIDINQIKNLAKRMGAK